LTTPSHQAPRYFALTASPTSYGTHARLRPPPRLLSGGDGGSGDPDAPPSIAEGAGERRGEEGRERESEAREAMGDDKGADDRNSHRETERGSGERNTHTHTHTRTHTNTQRTERERQRAFTENNNDRSSSQLRPPYPTHMINHLAQSYINKICT